MTKHEKQWDCSVFERDPPTDRDKILLKRSVIPVYFSNLPIMAINPCRKLLAGDGGSGDPYFTPSLMDDFKTAGSRKCRASRIICTIARRQSAQDTRVKHECDGRQLRYRRNDTD
jgi:hypothetical protein